MRIDVLTIFPEMFPPVLGTSILKRAAEKGVVQTKVHDLRDWTADPHHTADDRPYGGGAGMVMKCEPFFEAVDDLKKQVMSHESSVKSGSTHDPRPMTHNPNRPHVVLLSPQGKRMTQAVVRALAEKEWLILLCGHYEGVDDRVAEGLADEVLSIGDYVLTCGELPAMVLVDSVVRLLPGSLGNADSPLEESFSQEHLLEYPQYTRPVEYRGMTVPEVLLSGDHQAIGRWRKEQAKARTAERKSDLTHGFQN